MVQQAQLEQLDSNQALTNRTNLVTHSKVEAIEAELELLELLEM